MSVSDLMGRIGQILTSLCDIRYAEEISIVSFDRADSGRDQCRQPDSARALMAVAPDGGDEKWDTTARPDRHQENGAARTARR